MMRDCTRKEKSNFPDGMVFLTIRDQLISISSSRKRKPLVFVPISLDIKSVKNGFGDNNRKITNRWWSKSIGEGVYKEKSLNVC